MFDRYLSYARARRALKQGAFGDVLRLVDQPMIRGERRAEDLRRAALAGLLTRARRRRDDGNLTAGLEDVDLVLARAPEFDGAATLRGEIESGLADARTRSQAAEGLRREALQLADRGDLHAAEARLEEAASAAPDNPDHAAVERRIRARRNALGQDVEQLRSALAGDDPNALRPALARLAGAADQPDVAELLAVASERLASAFASRLGSAHDSEAVGSVLDELAEARSVCPGLQQHRGIAAALDAVAERCAARLRALGASGDLQGLEVEARGVHRVLRERRPLRALCEGAQLLAGAQEQRSGGDLGRAREAMQRAAELLQLAAVERQRAELAEHEARAEAALARSRTLAAEGKLPEARDQLEPVLAAWPMHEPLRRQVQILDQQAEERQRRLQHARALVEQARLAEASAVLLGLAADGDEGRQARLLLADVGRRMDLAADGLAQVRRAVHGQATANQEGLRHCVARLQQIASIQSDLGAVEELRGALQAEIDGLERIAALGRAVDGDDPVAAAEGLGAFLELRRALLRPDRLDARFLDVADRMVHGAQARRHTARLSAAARWLDVVAAAGESYPELGERVAAMRQEIAVAQRDALTLLEPVEGHESSDFAHTADAVDAARAVWVDCPRLAAVEARLLALERHASAAAKVEQLTSEGDLDGAHRHLHGMPPTPSLLRTRIFDIKQGLAKAQGLEQGFLLRVDEGGEYLVLRDDSLTLGNIRDGKADVRLLANISGVHARLQRSMSFHGGLEDRVVAERGAVHVNGEPVENAVLRSGDRIRLGSAVDLLYRMPSKRSLTAWLRLGSGFQVAGTDKLLLMKDRGRDGRILIGRADDAHVRVPHDAEEVEVFSANDGQVRVRCARGGEIDGRPFRGEHPVPAGAVVRCGAVSFVLQPWTRGA